jgi:hypothetical protein
MTVRAVKPFVVEPVVHDVHDAGPVTDFQVSNEHGEHEEPSDPV